MTETEKAMAHDREMEEKHHGISPIEQCVELAAQELDVSKESTYVVMFAFVLGGYKALCSSSEIYDDHGVYVEVVYNNQRDEFYVIRYDETDRKRV